jgi:uncharacterized protein (DUF1684 family)
MLPTFALLSLLLSALTSALPDSPPADWAAEVERWRETREADLKKEDGWLSVAGLYFLHDGVNTVGADSRADVVLPDEAAPAAAGRMIYEGGRVRFEPAAGVATSLNGRAVGGPVTLAAADAAADRQADRLTIGRITLQLHPSGGRLGVRLRDPESPYRRGFTGLRWFAVDPKWRIAGRLVPYDTPRNVEIQNILGDVETMQSPGEVEAAVNGTVVRLVALKAARGRLWLIFSDRTAGDLTYRIRFLYTDPPDASGAVVVDFNRAYNPPCAYNPHTTCPLPPRQNRLPVAVTAGERKYAGHGSANSND